MKTGRVEVTVLFIICLYLLNPCDISAYTYLVEEVGVFWCAERKNESDIRVVKYHSRKKLRKCLYQRYQHHSIHCAARL